MGPVVSLGANPLFAIGGDLSLTTVETDELTWSEPGQDAIITDIVITLSGFAGHCSCISSVKFEHGSETLAEFGLWSGNTIGVVEPTVVNFSSGIRIPEGETLKLSSVIYHTDCYAYSPRATYTLSGYYAEP